jgi:hypothetical protein
VNKNSGDEARAGVRQGKTVPPLLFLTSRILETEPYRSDRFEVGFGLATRNRLAPRLGAIRFREKGILLCSSTSLGAPGP